jgi:Na+-translocating ferredoxin:NAD+ oxidoreductase RnfE subunit
MFFSSLCSKFLLFKSKYNLVKRRVRIARYINILHTLLSTVTMVMTSHYNTHNYNKYTASTLLH